MSPGKPLLLIDVDGPLNPYARSNNQLRKTGSSTSNASVEERFHLYKLLGYRVWLNRWHGQQLCALADRFELTWCTTWQHEANSLIAPRIGLPKLPVIEFPDSPPKPDSRIYFKTPTVVKYAAGRPFAWLDDEITTWDEKYIRQYHDGPSLLVWIDPITGLQRTHFTTLTDWATELTANQEPAPECST
jgi:hypothetical protein